MTHTVQIEGLRTLVGTSVGQRWPPSPGPAPSPPSSGNTFRYRLNRGGDRRLNRSLTTIVIVRMRIDPATRAYVARRRAEDRTAKEIMRSLKRYITRQLYRTLAATHPIPAT